MDCQQNKTAATLVSYEKASVGEENNMKTDVLLPSNPPTIWQNKVEIDEKLQSLIQGSTRIPRIGGRCCTIYDFAQKTEHGSNKLSIYLNT